MAIAQGQDAWLHNLPLPPMQRPSLSLYSDELNALKDKQNRWREKHDEHMERKHSKLEAAGAHALPALHPLLG
eukprot:CAMPEP_0176129092 /NCGR_PEP_ID=MMETSP0120_2-20121206/65256_1 /TAXON_ID=160619 /ORGANISM="Kryptoperidinium foliaceum, Strain CCMP 1326" /LENGTH=72 /DNA_ID=CAMNT_0017464245 /DNA_START=45 /DNA_END=260 /DNA_ORIENTATION=-